MKYFSIFCLVLFVVINTGCPVKSCIEATYSFELQFQYIPDKDSIKIGDTLYLISTTSKTMIDVSGKRVDYSDAEKIGTDLSIGQLTTDSIFPIDAVFNFDYITLKGKVYNDRSVPRPDGIQQIEFEETDTSYELKIGLIAKMPGIYAIGIGDAISNGRKGVNGCQKAGFQSSIIRTDQHFYYYKNWNPNAALDGLNSPKLYCFKVY